LIEPLPDLPVENVVLFWEEVLFYAYWDILWGIFL
jgi:hypothetical protein